MEQLLLSAVVLVVKLIALFMFVSILEHCAAALEGLLNCIGRIRSDFIREMTHLCVALFWLSTMFKLFPLLFDVFAFTPDAAVD